ncbi:MAG: hypothetical protein EP343_04545 [Deltaproteobacteria bacterium]|nr:MAG: hypothetical protein EP343_04545 [Deltaproteobacteria bacterium]
MKTVSLVGCVLWLGVAWMTLGCTTRATRSSARDLGAYRLTVYWLSSERRFRGRKLYSLYDGKLRISRVSRRFAKALRLQGSGRLNDGTIVQYVRRCRGRCMQVRVINRQVFPMGVGAAGVALQPLRSVAASRRFRFGSSLYIPKLARILRKRGQEHSGCFMVHDRGGRIRGKRLDLFTGSRRIFRRFVGRSLPRYVRVYVNHPRCSSHVASR